MARITSSFLCDGYWLFGPSVVQVFVEPEQLFPLFLSMNALLATARTDSVGEWHWSIEWAANN